MRQRVFYLDFLRSFAVVMVLLLHSISNYIVNPELFGTTSWYINLFLNAISRAGVPIFFMISGCLILSSDKTKDFKKFYNKNLVHIAIPLVIWNVVYFIYKCIMGYIDFDISVLLNEFFDCGTEYHLWYLYTLIGIYLIAPFIKILVDNCSMKQLCWLLFLMMFCTTIRPFINVATPLYIYFFDPLFNGYIGYFLMGYILGKVNYTYKHLIGFGIMGLLSIAVSVAFHHINSSTDGINLIFNYGYSLCHSALAASIFAVSKLVFDKKSLFKGLVSVLSKYSFGIYLVHVIVIDLVVNHFMIDASPIVSSLYIFVIDITVSLFVSFILSKIKLSALNFKSPAA